MLLINPYQIYPATGSTLLGSWDLDSYADKAALQAVGWIFEVAGNWDLVTDGANKALTGTSGYIRSPEVRADSSGIKTLRLVCQMKLPPIGGEQSVIRFKDGGTVDEAVIRVNSQEKFRARQWDGVTTMLTETNSRTTGAYEGLEIDCFIDDTAGFWGFKRNGANNGTFTGDNNAGTCNGLNYIQFTAPTEGMHIKAIEIWSD